MTDSWTKTRSKPSILTDKPNAERMTPIAALSRSAFSVMMVGFTAYSENYRPIVRAGSTEAYADAHADVVAAGKSDAGYVRIGDQRFTGPSAPVTKLKTPVGRPASTKHMSISQLVGSLRPVYGRPYCRRRGQRRMARPIALRGSEW